MENAKVAARNIPAFKEENWGQLLNEDRLDLKTKISLSAGEFGLTGACSWSKNVP